MKYVTLRSVTLFAGLLVSARLGCFADTFAYNIEEQVNTNGTASVSFTSPTLFTHPVIITSDYPSFTESSTDFGEVVKVNLFPTSCPDAATYRGVLACVYVVQQYAVGFVYFGSALDSVGTFPSLFDKSYLTISEIPSAAAVTPEPSGVALLGTGLLGLTLGARRRWPRR